MVPKQNNRILDLNRSGRDHYKKQLEAIENKKKERDEVTKITERKSFYLDKIKERDYSSNQLDGMTEMKPINLTSVHLVKINGGTRRLINVKTRRINMFNFSGHNGRSIWS